MCVVLIFILDYPSFPSIVVSFALLPSSEFHSVSLEVGLVLDDFHKPHPAEQNPDSVACHRAAEPARLRGGKAIYPFFSFFSDVALFKANSLHQKAA